MKEPGRTIAAGVAAVAFYLVASNGYDHFYGNHNLAETLPPERHSIYTDPGWEAFDKQVANCANRVSLECR